VELEAYFQRMRNQYSLLLEEFKKELPKKTSLIDFEKQKVVRPWSRSDEKLSYRKRF
jgi:hypothetical protein